MHPDAFCICTSVQLEHLSVICGIESRERLFISLGISGIVHQLCRIVTQIIAEINHIVFDRRRRRCFDRRLGRFVTGRFIDRFIVRQLCVRPDCIIAEARIARIQRKGQRLCAFNRNGNFNRLGIIHQDLGPLHLFPVYLYDKSGSVALDFLWHHLIDHAYERSKIFIIQARNIDFQKGKTFFGAMGSDSLFIILFEHMDLLSLAVRVQSRKEAAFSVLKDFPSGILFDPFWLLQQQIA